MKQLLIVVLSAAAALGFWRAGVSRRALEPGVLTVQVERRAAQWEAHKAPPSARVIDIVISDAETAALEDMLPASTDGLSAWDSQALTVADRSAWKSLKAWFRRKFLRRSMAAPQDSMFAKSFADDRDAVFWTHEGFATASEAEMTREIGRALSKAKAAGAEVNIVTQGISAVPALRAVGALKEGKGAVNKFVAVDMNAPTLHKYAPAEYPKFDLPDSLREWAGVWTSEVAPETATIELYSKAYDGTRFSCTDVLKVLGVEGESSAADVIWLVKSLIKQAFPLEQVPLYLEKTSRALASEQAAIEAAEKHKADFARKKAKKNSTKPEDSLSAINTAWLANESKKADGAAGDGEKPQPGGEGAPKRTGWENYDEKCGQCCADAGGSWDAGDRRHCCVGADYDEEVPSCRVTWVDKGGRSHDCTYRMGCRRPD